MIPSHTMLRIAEGSKVTVKEEVPAFSRYGARTFGGNCTTEPEMDRAESRSQIGRLRDARNRNMKLGVPKAVEQPKGEYRQRGRRDHDEGGTRLCLHRSN